MNKVYQAIQSRIKKINFSKLWPGFIPYEFALYNDEKVYFEFEEISLTNQFIGNTTINYNGKQIAIWKVDERSSENIDLLTASIIHEMYHAHQIISGESRFFSDLIGLSYPYEYQNLNIKLNEFMYLAKAILEERTDEKQTAFNKFIALRQERFELLGDMSHYEKAIETIEGTAEYLALVVLKDIQPNAYKMQIDKAVKFITTLDENLLDVRRSAYYSGALICLLADELEIEYKKLLEPNLKYNYDLISEKYVNETADDLPLEEYQLIAQLINENHKKVSELVNEMTSNSKVDVRQGMFSVRGYDPMNMKRFENFVYHKHFLGIHHEGNTEFLMGPVLIETDGRDFSKFTKYYFMQNDHLNK